MPLPLEIQEYIIDIFADDNTRPDLLRLRLACRGWVPRIDFHAFKALRLNVEEGVSFLNFIKESKFGIARHIKWLTITTLTDQSGLSDLLDSFPQLEGYFSPQDYLTDFTSHLTYLETLDLINLRLSHLEWVPVFPNIQRLLFWNISLTVSQLRRLISAAKSLRSIRQGFSTVYEDVDMDTTAKAFIFRSPDLDQGDGAQGLSQREIFWPDLTKYAAIFGLQDSGSVERSLFPLTASSSIPSLRYLTLDSIYGETIPVVARIIKATSQSLQYLWLEFVKYIDIDDEFQRWFDLSQHMKLEYVHFESVRQPKRQVDGVTIILKSLPKRGSGITVCLSFIKEWKAGYRDTERVDQILAANTAVTKVEIIPSELGEKEMITKEFPSLVAKKVLWVGPKSEARSLFP